MSNPSLSSEPTTTTPTPGGAPSTGASVSATAVHDAIASGNAAFVAAFRGGDARALAACYTADAQLLPANSDVVDGRAAIEAFWQRVLALGLNGARLDTLEVYHTSGALTATEVGRYILTAGEEQVADRGKYVVIWREGADGAWRLHRDIWTSSQPPAGAA